MEKNKIIILALIAVIAVLLVALAAFMVPNMNKQDTNLTFKCKSTITEGDSIKIILTDSNGTAIANQTVNVTVTHKDKSSDYHSVVTNEKGSAKLKLDNDPGKYIITIIYGGNDKFNGCNATKKITIEEEVVEEAAEQTYSQDSSYTAQTDDSSYESGYNNMPEETRKIYAARQLAADDGIPMYEYIQSPELVEKYQAMV